MLPGGLEVVGLFVTTPPDTAKGLYPRLRLLLEQLHSICSPSRYLEGAEASLLNPPHTHSILLLTCPTTGKYPLHLCVWVGVCAFVHVWVEVVKSH